MHKNIMVWSTTQRWYDLIIHVIGNCITKEVEVFLIPTKSCPAKQIKRMKESTRKAAPKEIPRTDFLQEKINYLRENHICHEYLQLARVQSWGDSDSHVSLTLYWPRLHINRRKDSYINIKRGMPRIGSWALSSPSPVFMSPQILFPSTIYTQYCMIQTFPIDFQQTI